MPVTSAIRLQTASLYVSSYTAVFAGSGGPYGYSPETGEFGGIISSAGLAAEPFHDSLTGVMAGDVITFVTVIENTAAAPAYALQLRNTLPPGFSLLDVQDVSLTDGTGTPISYSGLLFDGAGGLITSPGVALAPYDANSGRNVLLLTYTLQVPNQVAIPYANLRSDTTLVQYATSPGGPPVLSGTSDGTPVTSASPTFTITGPAQPLALGGTGAFTVTITLPEGQVTDLRLDDLLSPNLAFVSASVQRAGHQLSGVTSALSGTSLRLGSVLDTSDGVTDAQDQLVVSVVARATQGGAGQLTATLSAADPAGGPRWSALATAAATVAAPVLSLSVQAPSVAQAGQVVTVQITLRNTGAAPARSVYLTDRLGPGLTVVPGSIGGTGTVAAALPLAGGVQLGALAAGEALLVTLQATVGADVLPGTTLDAGADAFGLVPGSSTTVTATAPGIITGVGPAISLTPFGSGVRVGDVVTVGGTVQVPPGPNPGVQVTIVLPAGLRYVAGSAGPGASAVGQAVTIPLGAYTAAQTIAVSLQAQVDGTAPLGSATVGAKVSTGYAATAADVTAVVVLNSAPVLTGVPAQLAALDTAVITPFAAVTLVDANANQTETATILSDPVHGTLAGPGVYDPVTGNFVLSGSAAAVTAGLASVHFLPVRRLVPAGQSASTALTLQVNDGAGGVASAVSHLAVTTANSVPVVSGGAAGQLTTLTLVAVPFALLNLTDADVGQGGTLTIRNLSPAVGTLAGLGTIAGVFQQTGSLAQLQAAARAMTFTPNAAGTARFAVTLDDHAGGVAQDTATTVTVAPSIGYPVQRFPLSADANFVTIVGSTQAVLRGETYGGPVNYLQSQLIYDGNNPVVIGARSSNVFIKTFAGDCAIQVNDGRNIVDAGQGSNFIVGGTGNDVFYLNGTEGTIAWDTIVNFHPGDQVTLFGFTAGVSTYTWADNDGAPGYTGRTIHAVLSGTGPVTASLTFAGLTAADTARFGLGTASISGLNYLAIESH